MNELFNVLDPDPICTIPPVIVSPLSIPTITSLPEQITLRNLPPLWEISGAGQGIKIGIIDTGIDTNHSEFEGRIRRAADFTGSSRGPADVQGHGTHVASLAAGKSVGGAPKADIYSYKALGDEGWGRSSWIAQAVRAAISDGVHIINMSLGSASASTEIYNALKAAYSAGIIVLAATGNDGQSRNGYPADFNDVCAAVGALDFQKRVARFSNTGQGTDLVDYGVNVIGAKPRGGYVRMSGTSMATPVACGIITNRLSYEKRYNLPIPTTLKERYKQLQLFCDDLGRTGHDGQTGWGQINARKAFGDQPITRPEPEPKPDPNPVPDPKPIEEPDTSFEILGNLWRKEGHLYVSNLEGEMIRLPR